MKNRLRLTQSQKLELSKAILNSKHSLNMYECLYVLNNLPNAMDTPGFKEKCLGKLKVWNELYKKREDDPVAEKEEERKIELAYFKPELYKKEIDNHIDEINQNLIKNGHRPISNDMQHYYQYLRF